MTSWFRRGRRPGRWFTSALFLVLTGSLGFVAPCRAAGLVIQAPNLTVKAGSSGSFDVLLVDTDPTGTAGFKVAGATLQIDLSGSAGSAIQFTDATINTVSATYIFTQSTDGNNGLPLFTNTLPDTTLITADTGDVVAGYPGYTTVNPGDTFGLAHVSYTVSSTAAPGSSDSITFVLANNATSLSDPNQGAIPFTAMNGSFTLAGAIPEPSTWMQGTIAVLMGLGAFCWRRRVDRRRSGRLPFVRS
jgi:hypothetical protein